MSPELVNEHCKNSDFSNKKGIYRDLIPEGNAVETGTELLSVSCEKCFRAAVTPRGRGCHACRRLELQNSLSCFSRLVDFLRHRPSANETQAGGEFRSSPGETDSGCSYRDKKYYSI